MNQVELVRQTTLHALADGVAVHDEVEAVAPGHPIVGLARAGDIAGVLGAVAVNDHERAAFSRIAGQPERALAVVRALAAVKPPHAHLRGPLAYFALVLFVEGGGNAIIGSFVAPVLVQHLDGRYQPFAPAVVTVLAICAAIGCLIAALLSGSLGVAALAQARRLVVDAVATGSSTPAVEAAAVLTALRARVDRLALMVRLAGTVLVVLLAVIILIATYAPIAALGGVT